MNQRKLIIIPLVTLAIAAMSLIAYLIQHFYADHAEVLSDAILKAERIDVKVSGGASPTGAAFRYTLSDEVLIQEVAQEIKYSPRNHFVWGIPAVDDTVTVMAFQDRLDTNPVSQITFCFTGDTYSKQNNNDLGVRVFQIDSKGFYNQLSQGGTDAINGLLI